MGKVDGFQILEYIRSSIEIIMNLKIEDLERDMGNKRHTGSANGNDDSSRYSVSSTSFVHASMKEALAMRSTQNGNSSS